MSYINRAIPLDKWCYAEYRDILTPLTHAFVLNTYDLMGNGILPSTFNQNINGFTLASDSRVTYTGLTPELIEFNVDIQGLTHATSGGTLLEGAIFLNGVVVANSQIQFQTSNVANDAVPYNYKHELNVNNGDIVDFRIRNLSRTEAGTFRQFQITIKTILNLL